MCRKHGNTCYCDEKGCHQICATQLTDIDQCCCIFRGNVPEWCSCSWQLSLSCWVSSLDLRECCSEIDKGLDEISKNQCHERLSIARCVGIKDVWLNDMTYLSCSCAGGRNQTNDIKHQLEPSRKAAMQLLNTYEDAHCLTHTETTWPSSQVQPFSKWWHQVQSHHHQFYSSHPSFSAADGSKRRSTSVSYREQWNSRLSHWDVLGPCW